MATLEELAARLRAANPANKPMTLGWMADQFWPGENWTKRRSTHHNGGARCGALVAAGTAGRMAKRGLLRRHIGPLASTKSLWVWTPESGEE